MHLCGSKPCRPAVAGPVYRPSHVAHTHQVNKRPHALSTTSSSSSSDTVTSTAQPTATAAAGDGVSRCPVLSQLRTPPDAAIPWWTRIQQIFTPRAFQRKAIGSNSVVHLTAVLSLPEQYYVATADLAKQLLGDESSGAVTVDDKMVDFVADLFGRKSLVMVPEPRHSFLRNLMMPAFTPEAINRSLPQLEEVVQEWLGRWEAAEGQVKAYDAFKAMTFDFIMRAVFGRAYPTDEVVRLSSLFKTYTAGFLGWPYMDIPFTPFSKALAARKQLVQALVEGLESVKAEAAAGRNPEGVVANILAAEQELGDRLSQQEWEDNLLVLLLAGHDTSSATLTRLMANLEEYPHVLEQLRQEQAQVLRKHGQQLTAAALKDMVYADAVVRETLRRDNIVAAITRRTAQDYDAGGFAIPAGSMVQVPLTDLALRDPRWRGADGELSPTEFNPQRLLDKEGSKPGWSMPFGYGPRFCVGYTLAMAEMKVFLALLARQYTFSADVNTTWSEAVGKVPANGLPITFKRLEQPLCRSTRVKV